MPAEILPKIDIGALEYRDWIRLWVTDNGIGIAPEYQERIFRVFERLHGVEICLGTGIGDSIVRKGLERVRGRSVAVILTWLGHSLLDCSAKSRSQSQPYNQWIERYAYF